MAIKIPIRIHRLGHLDARYEDLIRETFEEKGLEIEKVDVAPEYLTAFAVAKSEAQAGEARGLENAVSARLWPPQSTSPTTHIGNVQGAVHTGSGNLNIQVTFSGDVLLQKVEAALDAAEVPPAKKEGLMRAVKKFVQETGPDLAAKFAAELIKGLTS